MTNRPPPHDLDAERSVLGAALMDRETIERTLTPDAFYQTGHQILWRAILALDEDDKSVDVVTLMHYLKARNELEQVGGGGYIAGLSLHYVGAWNTPHHIHIVLESHRKRSILHAAMLVGEKVHTDTTADAILADFNISAAVDISTGDHSKCLRDLIKPTFDSIEDAYNQKGVIGYPTGFPKLDHEAPFMPGETTVIAGRPGMGKTALMINLMRGWAGNGIPVGCYSLEMTEQQLTKRLLSQIGLVNGKRVRRGDLHESDWPKLTRAAGIMAELPIFIDDRVGLKWEQVRSGAVRMIARHGIKVLVVDHLGEMGGDYDERKRFSQNIQGLRNMGKELNIAMVVLAQLNRESVKDKPRQPRMSDLAASGDIEQKANTIIFIHRLEELLRSMGLEVPADKEGMADLIIGKNREGETGYISMRWFGERTSFEELDSRYD